MTIIDEAPFSCVVRKNRVGYLGIATIEADPCTPHVHTRLPDEPDGPDGHLTVGVQVLGTSRVTQNGREALVRPGEMCVVATDRRFALEHERHVRLHVFRVPRRAVAVADRDLDVVTATAIAPAAGSPAVVTALLTSLARSPLSFSPAVAERLAGNVTDLLATVIAEQTHVTAPEQAASRFGELVQRVRDYIDANLGDPDLSPERIARSQRISLRYLHRMFESEEITVARLIQRRRLEECARELARRGHSSPTVAAVAGRWGFVSPAHFSRAFRAMYGVSPREWRARGEGRDGEAPVLGEPASAARHLGASSHFHRTPGARS